MKNSQLYDLRHVVTLKCNLACPYCLNEGNSIPTYRGGIAAPKPEVSLSQTLMLYDEMIKTLGSNLRVFNITGGEPTVRGVDYLETVFGYINNKIAAPKWLNSNATLLTPNFVNRLHQVGLRTVKINFPTMNPKRHGFVMGRENILQPQIAGVTACINAGWDVDLNIPLMKGVNDSLEEIVLYAPFFQLAKETGSNVRLKFFGLEKGMYGAESDEIFNQRYKMPTQSLISEVIEKEQPVSEYIEDFGRMRNYELFIEETLFHIVIVEHVSPQSIKGFPTQQNSFMFTPDGRLARMWDENRFSYQFDFSAMAKPLDYQFQEAIEYLHSHPYIS